MNLSGRDMAQAVSHWPRRGGLGLHPDQSMWDL
jgi:hypothetical protein